MADNNKIIQKLADLANPDTMTSKDFIKNYKIVINHVIEAKKMLASAFEKLKGDFDNKKKELDKVNTENIKAINREIDKEMQKLGINFQNLKNSIDVKVAMLQDGKDGKDADENKVAEKVLSMIDIPKIEELENNLPKLGAKIRDALELLSGDERLSVEAISGLDEKIDKLEEMIKSVRATRGGGTGGSNQAVQFADLTAQCDGVTKDFTVPRHRFAVALQGTQYPIIYRPGIDYTTENLKLTLTDEVSAPETTQTLVFLYVK